MELISTIVSAFLHRMNVPNEEVARFADLIKERRVSMLFDSFEAYDVQETRRISRAEGIQQGMQECILDFLEELGEVPEGLRKQIIEEKEIVVLRHWHKLAARVKDINDFI